MKRYKVYWLEYHSYTVDAEDETHAVEKAYEKESSLTEDTRRLDGVEEEERDWMDAGHSALES